MRRIMPMLVGLLSLMSIAVYPITAQGGSVVNIVNNRSDLETLAQFIDAAPEVRDALSSETVTLLAPTDIAFENLASALNTPLVNLIGSVEIVTALLNYHTLDGNVTASTLRNRAGQVIPTRLTSAFVGISINTDDQIVVNNVVEVVEPNIAASNGRIHIINDVLLNRVIDDLIDDLNFTDLIVPNITDTPTATATLTPTETTTAAATRPQGNIRLAHIATDIEEVTVLLESIPFAEALSYSTVTPFSAQTQGIYTIDVRSEDDRTLLESDITLLNQDFLTVAIVGSLATDSLALVTVTEDYTPLADDTAARFSILHASEDAPAIDIFLDDEREIRDIAYREFDTFTLTGLSEITADDDDSDNQPTALTITATGNEDDVLATLNDLTLSAGTVNLLIFYGTEDDPQLQLITTDIDGQALAAPQAEATQATEVTETPEATTNALATNTPRPSRTPSTTATDSDD